MAVNGDLPWDARMLDKAASAILGETPLVEQWVSASGRTSKLRKQRIKLADNPWHGPSEASLRHAPKGTTRQLHPKNVDPTRRCKACGGPVSKFSAGTCGLCYALNALGKRADREANFNAYKDWYAFWEDYSSRVVWAWERNTGDIQPRHHRTIAQPDFVPQLIAEEEGLIPEGEGPLASLVQRHDAT